MNTANELRQRVAESSQLLASGTAQATALEDGSDDSHFLIGLTAGTATLPKGFTRTRRSWRKSFETSISFFGLRREDRTLAPGPIAASFNLYAMAECLYGGTEFHSLSEFDVGEAHASIAHNGISRLVVVPSMLRLLSERGLTGEVDASGLTSIICAGSKMDMRTLEATRRWAPNAAIYEYYGAAELSFVAAAKLVRNEHDSSGTRIGRPLPGVRLKIIDDGGRALPDGEPGNIYISSDMAAGGYLWTDGKGTSARVEGWYTVGDQGYLEHGILHVLGRKDDRILTSGKIVYPHEVELALEAIPGVSAAVVVGVPDELRGHRVVAAVLSSTGPVSATQLDAGLYGKLDKGKHPLQYFQLTELPETGRGKISTRVLQQWISIRDPRVRPL